MRTDLGCGKTRREKVADIQAEDRKLKDKPKSKGSKGRLVSRMLAPKISESKGEIGSFVRDTKK